MVVCDNIEFTDTPKYKEVIERLDCGHNVYLHGGSTTGKSAIAHELRYELGEGLEFIKRYCYIEIPRVIGCDTLAEICE